MQVTDSATTRRHPAAAASTQMLARVCDSADLSQLSLATLTSCWVESGLPQEILPGLMQQALAATDSEYAADAIYGQLTGPTAPPGFERLYARARARKFAAFARLLDPWIRAGTVVDLGAGGTDLLDALSTESKLIGVDIDLPDPRPGSRAELVTQTHADRIPLADDSVDTVIATGVLHHIEGDVRRRLLVDIARVLRRGGRLVLLEESFPERPRGATESTTLGPVGHQNDLFRALSNEDKFTFLAFTDWWGNRVMKGSTQIPLPYAFLTSEQWHVELAAVGLPVTTCRDLGLCSGGGHMASPRMLLLCQGR